MGAVPPLLVLGSSDGVVRALHGLDGSLRWEFTVGYPLKGPQLAAVSDRVYIATGHGHVYALRLDDGEMLWHRHVSYPGEPRFDDGVRVVAGGDIMAVNYARSDAPSTTMRCITVFDGQDGAERWVFRPARWPWLPRRLRLPQAGLALLDADTTGVYVTKIIDQSPPQPVKECTVLIDAMNGRRRWSTRQAAAHSHLTWGSRTSLSVANGTAYTLGEHVSAIAVHNGRLRWQHPSPSTRHRRVLVAGESVVCVAGGQVFVTYRARDGERLWQVQAQHRSIESMVLMEPTVYIGEGHTPSGFTITARDVLTGEARWVWPHSDQAEHPGRSDISWRFVGADDILYVPGPQVICAIRGSDGEQLWTWPTHDGIPALVAVPAARS